MDPLARPASEVVREPIGRAWQHGRKPAPPRLGQPLGYRTDPLARTPVPPPSGRPETPGPHHRRPPMLRRGDSGSPLDERFPDRPRRPRGCGRGTFPDDSVSPTLCREGTARTPGEPPRWAPRHQRPLPGTLPPPRAAGLRPPRSPAADVLPRATAPPVP